MTSFGTELHYSNNSPADFSISLSWDPSPFTYFHPDTVHIFSPYLSHPPSLPRALLFPQGHIHTSSSSIANRPLFPCCLWHQVQYRRREGSIELGSVSAVRQASVTVSTPVWCWGIHTWQINPHALSAAHNAHVKSSTLYRGWGDIFERHTRCGKPLHWETTHREEAMEARQV